MRASLPLLALLACPSAPEGSGGDGGRLAAGAADSSTADGGAHEGGGPDADSGPAPLTWYADVEPIAQASCQGCHAV
jgi:hypothetical protein